MEKEEEVLDLSKPPASLAGHDWSSLTELALHSIVIRLRSPAYFTAICGVCKSWRSAISSPFITSEFISSIPPLILLLHDSAYFSSAIFYSLADDAIYDSPSIPSFKSLAFFGQSNGYLLGFDESNGFIGPIPTIIDPLSGLRVHFPFFRHHSKFWFAILTAPPTSPKSHLVFSLFNNLFLCPIGGSRWSAHLFAPFTDAIFFQDRIYLTHWDNMNMSMCVVEYDLQTKANCMIFYSADRSGLLMESSEGELLMVFIEQGMLVGFKLLPRTGSVLTDNGETDWPGGGERILFLGCQRSDVSISCLMGDDRKKYRFLSITGNNRKKYRFHSISPFWRNYLAFSQVRSNGFYVFVDAHGRAELSKIQPDWVPFRPYLR